MNISRLWKTGHKLLKSTSSDETDAVVAGKDFKIRYLGSKNMHESTECLFNETAGEIIAQYSPKSLNSMLRFHLVIDSMSLEIRDGCGGEGGPVELLSIALPNIRDVLYRKRDKRYKNVIIFVARGTPGSPILKAHVLLSDNLHDTENIFETFKRAFAISNMIEDGCTKISHIEYSKQPKRDAEKPPGKYSKEQNNNNSNPLNEF